MQHLSAQVHNSLSCFLQQQRASQQPKAIRPSTTARHATAWTAEAAAEGGEEGDDDSDDDEDDPPREEARVVTASAGADYGALVCGGEKFIVIGIIVNYELLGFRNTTFFSHPASLT